MLLLFATPVTSPFFPFSRLDRLAQVAVVLIKSCATCLELSPKVFVSNPIIDLLPFARSLTLRPRKGPARIGQRSSYIVRSAAAARNGSDPCQILPAEYLVICRGWEAYASKSLSPEDIQNALKQFYA